MSKLPAPKLPTPAKVNEEAVRRWCATLGLNLPDDGEVALEALVVRLGAYHERIGRGSWLECEECGADCDGSLPVCPYCGIGDDAGSVTGTVEPAAISGPEESSTMTKRSQVKKAPEKKASKASVKKAPAKKEPAKKEPAKKASAAPKGRKVKPSKGAPPVVQVEAAEVFGDVPSSIVLGGPQLPDPVGDESVLDAQIAKVLRLHTSAVTNYWEIGHELHAIFKDRLYVLRKDPQGVSRYKSWGQFVQVELGMSTQHSYRVMEVACMFTREQVIELGITKLSLLAKLDDAERNRMLDRAPSTSVRELTTAVQTISGGQRRTPTVSQQAGREFRGGAEASAKGASRAATAKAAIKASTQVTVAQLLGRVTLPLMKKNRADRAFKLGDEPNAVERMVNGVKVTYKITLTPKGLTLIIERTRES